MNNKNVVNEGTDKSISNAKRKADGKKKKESFEIMIRGSEIYRINTHTKQVVQVFQCIDHCLRGNKTDEVYSGDFELLQHQFSITGKKSTENQYVINVFGDVMFAAAVNNIAGAQGENRSISAKYEECVNEYTASFIIMEEESVEIWIEIN